MWGSDDSDDEEDEETYKKNGNRGQPSQGGKKSYGLRGRNERGRKSGGGR